MIRAFVREKDSRNVESPIQSYSSHLPNDATWLPIIGMAIVLNAPVQIWVSFVARSIWPWPVGSMGKIRLRPTSAEAPYRKI
jgi:hypothetical protein